MYRLIIVFASMLLSGAFAHSQQHIALGDEASAMQAQGKTYHQSISAIRKLHPEILNHKRDKTLRQGIRTKQDSLIGCVNCHANKNLKTGQYHPVNAPDQFCATCHQKTSVSVDCFGCHRTKPQEDLL